MTTPRSPRGRRAKGNLGERTVKAILEKQGFPCVNGAGEEPGVDLWFNPEGAIEVKNQPWSTIGGTKRREMLAAAIRQRQEFRWHWVITHEASGWQVAEIGRTPEGKIGLLYKQPIEFFERGKRGLRPGEEEALAPAATSHAESGAVGKMDGGTQRVAETPTEAGSRGNGERSNPGEAEAFEGSKHPKPGRGVGEPANPRGRADASGNAQTQPLREASGVTRRSQALEDAPPPAAPPAKLHTFHGTIENGRFHLPPGSWPKGAKRIWPIAPEDGRLAGTKWMIEYEDGRVEEAPPAIEEE